MTEYKAISGQVTANFQALSPAALTMPMAVTEPFRQQKHFHFLLTHCEGVENTDAVFVAARQKDFAEKGPFTVGSKVKVMGTYYSLNTQPQRGLIVASEPVKVLSP